MADIWDTPPTEQEQAAVWAAPPTADELQQSPRFEDRAAAAQLRVLQQMPQAKRDWLLKSIQAGGSFTEGANEWFAGEAQDDFDRAQEQEFLAYRDAHPGVDPVLLEDARRLWIAKPEHSFQYILDNRDAVRAQVQTEQVDWRELKAQHPVLAAYLEDPDTASLALKEQATFKWYERIFGRSVTPEFKASEVGRRIAELRRMKAGKTSLAEAAAIDRELVPLLVKQDEAFAPSWALALRDAFNVRLPRLGRVLQRGFYDQVEQSLVEGLKEFDRVRAQGKTYPKDEAKFRAELADVRARKADIQRSIDRLTRELEVDRIGHPMQSSRAAKIGRGIQRGADFALGMAPELLAAYATGGSMLALAASNAAFSAPDIYERAQQVSGDPAKAAAVTLALAPVAGKLGTFGPESALVRPLSKVVEEGFNRAMLRAATESGKGRLFLLGARRFGVDYATAAASTALQQATTESGAQMAALLAGKETDPRAVARGFSTGLDAAWDSWLLMAFGTSKHVLEARGRALNAKAVVAQLDQLQAALQKSKMAGADSPTLDLALKQIGQRGDAAYLFDTEHFEKVTEALGVDPRETMAQVFGDGGSAWDKAKADGVGEIAIPVERLRKLAADPRFSDFVALAGRPNDAVWSGLQLAEAHARFEEATKAAEGKKPEAMTAEERTIFEQEKARALDDMDEGAATKQATELLKTLAGLQALMPDRSLIELRNDMRTVEDPTAVLSNDQKLARAFAGLGSPEARARAAFTDMNTGLDNAAAFARRQLKDGETYAHISFAGLKWFQDTLGDHAKGNALYREMAQALAKVRPDLAKVGPDFGSIVKESEAAGLAKVLNDALPAHLKPFEITVEVGKTWDEAAQAHRRLKDQLVAEGKREPARQQPRAWPKGLDPAQLELKAGPIERPASPDLVEAAEPGIAYRDQATGLMNTRGAEVVADPGDHQLALDVDGLGAIDRASPGVADAVMVQVGAMFRALGAAEALKGRRTGGDEVGAAGHPEALARFEKDLRKAGDAAIVSYTDPHSGKTWELKGIKFSAGLGADHGQAEAALAADKESRAAAGVRDPSRTPRDQARIALGRLTERAATGAELAAARRGLLGDQNRGRGDVQAGDVAGRDGSQDPSGLAPADRAVVNADLARAQEDAGVLNDIGVRDLLPEEERAQYDDTIGSAAEESRRQLDVALRANSREFIPQLREKFKRQAEAEIRKDPGQRAAHFWKTGELWDAPAQQKLLIDPQTKSPFRLWETDLLRELPAGIAHALREAGLGVVTRDASKSIAPDYAANLLGYTGEDAVRKLAGDLLGAVSEGQWIKEYTEANLKSALRPELLDDPQRLMERALAAVHNPKTAVKLQRDLQALARQLDPLRKAKAAMTPEMRAKFADQVLDSRTLAEARPEQFARASKRYMEKAQAALTEGKQDKAFDHVDAALLNHHLYVAARDRTARLEKHFNEIVERATSDSWRKKLGTADKSYQDLHDSLIGKLTGEEVPASGELLDTFLRKVGENSQDVNLAAGLEWDVDVVRSVLDGTRTWQELLPSEAEQVYKAIKNIQHIAKMQNAEADAVRSANLEADKQSIVRHLAKPQELAPGGPPVEPPNPLVQDVNAAPAPGAAKRLWGNFTLNLTGADLVAPRVMLKALGPVGERIWGEFLNRRNEERQLLHDLYMPWKETQKIWEKDPDFKKPLPGLAAKLRIKGMSGELTKQYLVNALRWAGSDSGRKKLLDGLGITLETLTDAAGQFLTVEEIQAVQKEWDFFETHHWPRMAEAHLRRYGLPLERVKAEELKIKLVTGNEITLKGGYWPIHWDRREGVAKQLQNPTTDQGAGTINPAVGDGSFKKRTKFVGVPDLNWDNIPGHMLADIHSLAYGDFVQQANRVLLAPEVRKAISERFGPEFAQQPRDWLWSVADASRDRVVESMAGMDVAGRYGRSALVTAALALRLPAAIADITTPFQTILMRHGGLAAVSHAAPAMSKVLQGYMSEAASGVNPVVEAARAESKVLAARADLLREDMYRWYGPNSDGTMGFRHGADKYAQIVQEVSFWHHRAMDGIISTMVYEAEKSYQLAKGLTNEEAIAKADDAVMAAMPSYDPKEQPAVLRHKHGPVAAALLVFHTVNSKIYEQINEQQRALGQRAFTDLGMGKVKKATLQAQFAGRALAMLTLYAVVGDYLMGQGKQNDEDWTDWLVRKELAAPFKIFPYGSNLAEPIVASALSGQKARDLPINVPQLTVPYNVYKALGAAFDRRKTSEESFVVALNAALTVTGMPARGLTVPGQYGYHLAAGDEEPRGALDVLSGFVYGRKYGRLRRYEQANPLTDMQSLVSEE